LIGLVINYYLRITLIKRKVYIVSPRKIGTMDCVKNGLTPINKLMADCFVELFADELEQTNQLPSIAEKYLLKAYELGRQEK